jgi:hypothetical protein
MSPESTALVVTPSKTRSKITNDPSKRHGRSAEARRVRDLFQGYMAALGDPMDAPMQALILAAAEAVTIAENARRDHLAGKIGVNDMIRAEGASNRALKRIGLNKPVSKPAGPTLGEFLAGRQAKDSS